MSRMRAALSFGSVGASTCRDHASTQLTVLRKGPQLMIPPIMRRIAPMGIGTAAASTALLQQANDGADATIRLTNRLVEIDVTPIGESIVRISVVPHEGGRPMPMPVDGSLVKDDWGAPKVRIDVALVAAVDRLTAGPCDRVGRAADDSRRRAGWSAGSGNPDRPRTAGFDFALGDGPVLGLGEGGPQFDRRGSVDRMRSGQGGYRLADPRRPRAGPLADRYSRLGDARPSAGRCVRPDRHRWTVHARPAARRCRWTSSS